MNTRGTRIVRLDYGYFVRPAEETGTGQARVEPVLGYAVMHSQGTMLLDTGMGAHADVDAHYRPRRVPLPVALQAGGLTDDDVKLIVNCHLHFDHCGGNPSLPGRPIIVQERELLAARGEDYTLPELIEAPGLRYDEIAGEAEPLPGVLVVPTPGHTDGHQSVIVRQADGTVVVLAGQSHDTATAYSADVLAGGQRRTGMHSRFPSHRTGFAVCVTWTRHACTSPTTTLFGPVVKP